MLSRKTPLRRLAPLRPRNVKRQRERFACCFGQRGALVRAMPCLVGVACRGAVQAAHARSRGAGGTRRDLVPLCARHHREQHDVGLATFMARHRVDLIAAAARIAADLDARGVA